MWFKKKPPYPMERTGNPLELIIITVLVIAGLLYIVPFASTGDPLWMMPTTFTQQPAAIEIYHGGQKTVLQPGDPGYVELTTELNEQITHHLKGYWEVGMRTEVIEESFAQSTTVVMLYEEPYRIHSRWALGKPNRFLIPITGSNSGQNRAYIGTGVRYGHGALILEDLARFSAIVQSDLGFRE